MLPTTIPPTQRCPHAKWPLGCSCPDDGTPHDAISDPVIACWDECDSHRDDVVNCFDPNSEVIRSTDEHKAACPNCSPRIDWTCSRHFHVTWCSPATEEAR